MLLVHRRTAFTLVELLVVIAIIGILVALLLPAVQAAREAGRRTQCSNQLRQIGLAMHNYESSYRALPPGGLHGNVHGHSWWVRILPFVEQSSVYDKYDQGVNSGWLGDGGNTTNRALVYDLKFDVMYCPSSTLDAVLKYESPHFMHIASATYAGIGGATNHPTAKDGNPSWGGGRLSFGGALASNRVVRLSSLSDGTSNTIVVGEQSGALIDSSGAKVDRRSDCGHGFTMGPGNDGTERQYNITTVLHRINEKSANAVGVTGNCAPNTPIQSTHPGGAQVVLGDGSVRMLMQTLDIQMLYNLANRDDGNPVVLE